MLLSAIIDRRSTREFKDTPVSEAMLLKIIQAAQYAPTGMNTRGVHFLVVRDQDTKNRLFDMLEPKQPFVKTAPALIFPVCDATKTIVATEDISIAAAFMMLQAASQGLGSVWKHIPADKAAAVKKLLGVPEHFALITGIPVGYPAKPLPAHHEKEFMVDKIHHEKW